MPTEDDHFPKNILLVDDDESVSNQVKEWYFLDGIKVEAIKDAEKAWQESNETIYDLIILDWNLCSKLDGAALFNRWKNSPRYQDTPVIVLVGSIERFEYSIVDEYPLVKIMEKPLREQDLTEAIAELSGQAHWYQEQKNSVNIVFNAMSRPDFLEQVFRLARQCPSPFHLYCAAGSVLLDHNRLQDAEIAYKHALVSKHNSILAINALGKIYLMQGKNSKAKLYLIKAYDLSPINVDRLCDLGDLYVQDLNLTEADKYYSKALEIDHENERASGSLKICGETSEWIKEFGDIPTSYASLLNSIGISKARSGLYKECIEHYHNALRMVYDNKLKSKLSFNLGMGYSRWSKKSEARSWFKKAIEYDPNFDKALRYLKKVSNISPSESLSTSDIMSSNEAQTQTQDIPSWGPSDPDRQENPMQTDSFPDDQSTDPVHSPEASSDEGDFCDSKIQTHEDDEERGSAKLYISGEQKEEIPANYFGSSKNSLEIFSEMDLQFGNQVLLKQNDKKFDLKVETMTLVEIPGRVIYFIRLICNDLSIDLESALQDFLTSGGKWGGSHSGNSSVPAA